MLAELYEFVWLILLTLLQYMTALYGDNIYDIHFNHGTNGFYTQFRQSLAKETFSYDEYLKS